VLALLAGHRRKTIRCSASPRYRRAGWPRLGSEIPSSREG
jgi:hypothetical protein